jgi:hypothetical protein
MGTRPQKRSERKIETPVRDAENNGNQEVEASECAAQSTRMSEKLRSRMEGSEAPQQTKGERQAAMETG